MRGGRRPGAGAPRGNINALGSALYSPRYNDAHGLLLTIPRLSAEIDAAMRQDPPSGRRLRARCLEAAAAVIRTTPDLATQLEGVIFSHPDRVRRLQNGDLILNALVEPPRVPRLAWVFAASAWLIKRDEVLAGALVGILLPPLQEALARQATDAAKTHDKTIKQSNQPKSESTQGPRN